MGSRFLESKKAKSFFVRIITEEDGQGKKNLAFFLGLNANPGEISAGLQATAAEVDAPLILFAF